MKKTGRQSASSSSKTNELAKDDSSNQSNSEAASDGPTSEWSKRVRIIASILLSLHLAAVIIAPLADPPPTTRLFSEVGRSIDPYLQAMYLRHGYRFFAPEPGPSHVVRYEIIKSDGEIVEGKFPDRDAFWPRQLYHRWFMLSESLAFETARIPSEEEQKERNEEIAKQMEELKQEGSARMYQLAELQISDENAQIAYAKEQQKLLVEAIGKHLLEKHDGESVLLFIRQRAIPSMIDIEFGKSLDDKEFFSPEFEIALGTISRDQTVDGSTAESNEQEGTQP